MEKENQKNRTGKIFKKISLLILKEFSTPLILILIIFVFICFITDIFYIGVSNEEKSQMKEEIKYYTEKEYTEEDTTSFFGSVKDFISNLFGREVIENVNWPVVRNK